MDSHRAPARLGCGILLLLAGTAAANPPVYQTYFGNFHAHTAYSDGIGTPAEAYAYARDVAGIDVLAITDHTHYLSQTEWGNLLATAAQYSVDGEFVAMGAQEFGNLNDFGHMNLFACAARNPYGTEDLLSTYQFVQNQGGFGVFAHPSPEYGTNFNDLAFYPAYVEQMIGLEVRNGQRLGDYEAQYIEALQNGWRIAPLADQDNHEGHWGDQTNPNVAGQIYLTGILAESLSVTAIDEAFRARRFYAAEVRPISDRIALDLWAGDAPMGSSITSGASLALRGSARSLNGAGLFNRVDLFEDGIPVDAATLIGAQIEWVFYRGLADGESHFYFVRVRQVDGDHAWSAPIWVTAEVNPASTGEGPSAVEDAVTLRMENPSRWPLEVRLDCPPRSDPYSAELALRDASGRVLARDRRTLNPGGVDEWTPRLPHAPAAGSYFLTARLADGRVVARRVVLYR